MSRDLELCERAFKLLDREIWIVTSADGERRGGLLATTVSQASIDRESPVVTVSIARNHFTLELIDASGGFCAHLLLPEQVNLALSFAWDTGRNRDKLASVSHQITESGNPVLSQCLAWFDCRVFARCDRGDCICFWADVVAVGQPAEGVPLCEQSFFASLDDSQRRRLASDRDADLHIQRPLFQDWRQAVPESMLPRTRIG